MHNPRLIIIHYGVIELSMRSIINVRDKNEFKTSRDRQKQSLLDF